MHKPIFPPAGRPTPSSPKTSVALLGSTGFIGSQVLNALRASDDANVSILARSPLGPLRRAVSRTVIGDITNADAVAEAVRGADVVINAVSYVGRDPETAVRVNSHGTLTLLRACERFAVKRVVQVGTTAIYGSGPHRGLTVETASYSPESKVSEIRLQADQAVLAAGGTVIRPNLIYGPRDRWFIPGLVKMFRALGTTIEHGRSRLSLIDVADLGKLTATVATMPTPFTGAVHAVGAEPVSLANLLAAVSHTITPLDLVGSCSPEEAVLQLVPSGFSRHQVGMLALDNTFDAGGLWLTTGLAPQKFSLSAADTRTWYKEQLTSP